MAKASDLESQTLSLQQAAGQIVTLGAGGRLPGTNFVLEGRSDRFQKISYSKSYNGTTRFNKRPTRQRKVEYLEEVIKLAPSDVFRWQLASKAICEHGFEEPTYNDFDWLVLEARPSLRQFWGWDSTSTGFLFCLGVIIYGGIHAFAWNYSFPSGFEQ